MEKHGSDIERGADLLEALSKPIGVNEMGKNL
jgi:hypothetical protein